MLVHMPLPLQSLSRVALPLVADPFLKALVERVNPRRDSPLGRVHPDTVRAQVSAQGYVG